MKKTLISIAFLCGPYAANCFANDADEMAAMQKKLNAELMAKPFLAEQPEKVEAYIEDSLKKKIKPPTYSGNNWRPGYTCQNLLLFSWHEYRNCRYYYRFYGHYY